MGLFRLSPAFQSAYPKAAARIASLGTRVNSKMHGAFAKYGQATKCDVDAALAKGAGRLQRVRISPPILQGPTNPAPRTCRLQSGY